MKRVDFDEAYLCFIALFVFGLPAGLFVATVHTPAPQPVADTCPENMVCYEPSGAPVEPQYILTGSLVIVRWLPEDKMPKDTEAYASWEVDFENNFSACVITATPPEQVLGDPRMDALGHELLHCLTGEFHP